jgi:pimeloyl-ACP methyl ester carboxylesterase
MSTEAITDPVASTSDDDEKLTTATSTSKIVQHDIQCPNIGPLSVFVQGTRTSNEVVIMTVHDLGCDHHMFLEFVDHPKMRPIRDRTVWVHIDVPGQGIDAPDLPADYQFPRLQVIGEDLIHVLDSLNVKEVVCFGEGAGANILARFAMAHIDRVLGIVLMHATGSSAGFFDLLKEKMMSWKWETFSMTSSIEHYLILHRFGGGAKFSKAADKEELKAIIDSYHDVLHTKTNIRNLRPFVEAFHKRNNIEDFIKNLKCPVLLVTGQLSVFNATTRSLHQAITKTCEDKTKVEFIEVAGVANVIEEKPDKLAESFQYFLQGLGLVSSVPMHNVHKMLRNRTMSMEDYDRPMRERNNSVASGDGLAPPSPLSSSPHLQSPLSLSPPTEPIIME